MDTIRDSIQSVADNMLEFVGSINKSSCFNLSDRVAFFCDFSIMIMPDKNNELYGGGYVDGKATTIYKS